MVDDIPAMCGRVVRVDIKKSVIVLLAFFIGDVGRVK